MSRRRRGGSSDLSDDGDSDDDTNFKRRRLRSLSPGALAGDLTPPADQQQQLPRVDGSADYGAQDSYQPIPVADTGDSGGRTWRGRREHQEIRFEGARQPGRHNHSGTGGMMANNGWRGGGGRNRDSDWGGSRGGQRGSYFREGIQQPQQRQDQHSAVEPYVPEYAGTSGHQQPPLAGIFNDMPAAPMGLPLPFMPVMPAMPAVAAAAGTATSGPPPTPSGPQMPAWHGNPGSRPLPPDREATGHRRDDRRDREDFGAPSMPYKQQHSDQQPGRGWVRGGRGDGAGNRSGRGGSLSRSRQTLYITNLPNDIPDIRKALLHHFSKFGQVMEIRQKFGEPGVRMGMAWVQMATPHQAEAALNSPDAVLGNRFIRLEWAQRDVTSNYTQNNPGDHPHQPSGQHPNGSSTFDGQHVMQGGPRLDGRGGFNAPAPGMMPIQPPPAPPPRAQPPPPTAAPVPPTKPVAPTKTVEAKAVQELGRTAELLAKQIAAQKKMLEMLEARQKASGKEDGGTGRTDKAVTAGGRGLKTGSGTSSRGGAAMVRGRGRHGGRGPPRMQSRGQGSSWSKLDTRSTTVVRVVEIPSGTGLGDLRAHFSQFGVITGLEEDPPLGARVTFEARKQAEAAIVGGKRLGEHTMILQWGTSSPAVASAGLTPSGHTKAPALSRCTSGSGGIATSQSGRGAGEKLEAVAKEEKGSEPKVKTGSGMEADASEDQPEAKQEAAGQERATVEVRGEVAEVEEVSVADELPFESDSANPVEEDEGEEPPDVVDVADEGDEEDEHPDTVNMEDEEELEFDEAGEGHK